MRCAHHLVTTLLLHSIFLPQRQWRLPGEHLSTYLVTHHVVFAERCASQGSISDSET